MVLFGSFDCKYQKYMNMFCSDSPRIQSISPLAQPVCAGRPQYVVDIICLLTSDYSASRTRSTVD